MNFSDATDHAVLRAGHGRSSVRSDNVGADHDQIWWKGWTIAQHESRSGHGSTPVRQASDRSAVPWTGVRSLERLLPI